MYPLACSLFQSLRHVCLSRCNHRPAPQGAIWAAANLGNVAALQAALSAGGSTEEADGKDVSALTRAAYKGHLEAVFTLLCAGAKVDSRSQVCDVLYEVGRDAPTVEYLTPD